MFTRACSNGYAHDVTANRWHVSRTVDLTAYAFSWLIILVPLELLTHRDEQVVMLLLVVGLTFAHRHFTLPYIYLDREIFDAHPRRFTWFPLAMFAGFLVSPVLWASSGRWLVAGIVMVAGAWNVWHVYMQKFGVLRMYAAKSGSSIESPRWVDRLLLFCWVPLYLVWLGPSYRDQVASSFPTVDRYALPLIDAMTRLQPFLLVPAIGAVVAGLGAFLYFEWKSQRLANVPRLWMAFGTSLLSASFLFVSPVRMFMAFAFSHAVEYMVFVWAFQRTRYREPLGHDPALGRVLRHPLACLRRLHVRRHRALSVGALLGLSDCAGIDEPDPSRHDDRALGFLLERLPVARPLLLRRILVEDALGVGAPLPILVKTRDGA